MMRMFRAFLVCAPLFFALASCGGSGGSQQHLPSDSLNISFSANQLNFNAFAPWAIAGSGTLTASVSGTGTGTLYVLVKVNSPDLVSVSTPTITGHTGQITVTAMPASSVGIGKHTGSIVITACLNDPTCNTGQLNGSPKTIAINYEVQTNVQADSVVPHVVTENQTGVAILRSVSGVFTSSSSVTLGATAVTTQFVSNNELRITYPKMMTGEYPVTVDSGATGFNGTFKVVPEPSYPASYVPYPYNGITNALEYDQERQAVFAAVWSSSASTTQLLRYQYQNASWVNTATVDIPNIEQMHLSLDGKELLVMSGDGTGIVTYLNTLDPVTLAALNSPDGRTNQGQSFALTNDGNAIFGGTGTSAHIYSLTGGYVYSLPVSCSSCSTVVSSGDGSHAYFIGGYIYDASTGTVSNLTNPNISSGFDRLPTVDFSGSKIQSGVGVFGSDYQPLGYGALDQYDSSGNPLHLNVAAVINGDGSRLYVVDAPATGGPYLETYDLTAPTFIDNKNPDYPQFQAVGSPITLQSDPGLWTNNPMPSMVISPDGLFVIIAGETGFVVQPTPP